MRTKLLTTLALLLMAVSGAWTQGSGNPDDPWICGDCTVILSGGTLTVSGTGAMADYTDFTATPWCHREGRFH